MVRERLRDGYSGFLMLVVTLGYPALPIWVFFTGTRRVAAGEPNPFFFIGAILLGLLWLLLVKGFFTVAPNEAQVLQLFGSYVGTAKSAGLRWANPFFSKRRISLRVRNFESSRLKVNDADGNPIEIAAVIVWRVVETAEATFEVNDYENYVHVQSEAAVRNAATSYPYDAHH